MREKVARTGILFLGGWLVGAASFACGDKFLWVGRGARFTQVYAAVYPATILLYAHAPRGVSSALLDPGFQRSLTRAGHHIEVAKDEEHLGLALESGRIDLVLSDLDGIEAIAPSAERSQSKPELLPVVDKLPKALTAGIKARFPAEVKLSDRPATYLTTIDHQMQARTKRRSPRI